MRTYDYTVAVEWVGNDGRGTEPRDFSRTSELRADGLPAIPGDPPPSFGGAATGWSPEDLLLAALGQCQMLTYLFLCNRAGIVVESYEDAPVGTLAVLGREGGQFDKIVLRPRVTISAGDPALAESLHADAHSQCYIGRSLKSEVVIEPTVVTT